MPQLSIKDVPEDWTEALRRRAARHHRSLQGELMAIVEQAVMQEVPTLAASPTSFGSPQPVGHDRRGRPIVRQGWKTVEQVAAELRARHPRPIDSGPSSIELIREDRDSR